MKFGPARKQPLSDQNVRTCGQRAIAKANAQFIQHSIDAADKLNIRSVVRRHAQMPGKVQACGRTKFIKPCAGKVTRLADEVQLLERYRMVLPVGGHPHRAAQRACRAVNVAHQQLRFGAGRFQKIGGFGNVAARFDPGDHVSGNFSGARLLARQKQHRRHIDERVGRWREPVCPRIGLGGLRKKCAPVTRCCTQRPVFQQAPVQAVDRGIGIILGKAGGAELCPGMVQRPGPCRCKYARKISRHHCVKMLPCPAKTISFLIRRGCECRGR